MSLVHLTAIVVSVSIIVAALAVWLWYLHKLVFALAELVELLTKQVSQLVEIVKLLTEQVTEHEIRLDAEIEDKFRRTFTGPH